MAGESAYAEEKDCGNGKPTFDIVLAQFTASFVFHIPIHVAPYTKEVDRRE